MMDDMNDNKEQDEPQSKSYGKHSIWWWLVVYLIAAVIVYGIIYLVFFNHMGSTGTPGY
jgi:flagellar basal body-associated protein FliL